MDNPYTTYTPVTGPSPFDGTRGAAYTGGANAANTASSSPASDTGALDWDSEIAGGSAPEFTVLPEGDYPFTVTKFERQHHPGSAKLPPCGKAVLTIALDGGAGGTSTVTENLFLHVRTQWKIGQFLESIGQRPVGSEESLRPRWNEIAGARGWCHVAVEEYRSQKYGDTRQKNTITKFLPPRTSGSTTPHTAPQENIPQQTAMPLPPNRRF